MQKLEAIQQKLLASWRGLARKYHIKQLGIFGSYVKNTQTAQSDLDLLVDFEEVPSLFSFVGLKLELSDLSGMDVDLVTRSGLKPQIGKRILQEVIFVE